MGQMGTLTPTQIFPRTDADADARESSAAPWNYTRPFLYPTQEAAIFTSERWSWIEATTKAGKTSGCIVWLIEQALGGQPGENYWWVAPTKPVAKIAFTRAIHAFEPGTVETNETERRITVHGRHLWFKGGDDPDNLYGEDVHAAVIDEASRMKAEAWHAIRSTLTATGGPARIIGNVKGRKNWFFKGCRRAESGLKNSRYFKITSKDAVAAGIMSQEEVDDARRNLPEDVFNELYNAEATVDGSNPFGIEAIRECIIPNQSLRPIAAWGWDLAKRQDWTYGVALDSEGSEVKTLRFQLPWRETRTRILLETAGRPALIDATGVGDPILEDLQAEPGANFEGYVFTSRSKQELMVNLAVAIQNTDIGLTDTVLLNELESFEFEYTATGVRYSAPEGMHDDGVCALALAKKRLGGRSQPFASSRVRADAIPVAGNERPDGSASPPQDDEWRRPGMDEQSGLM